MTTSQLDFFEQVKNLSQKIDVLDTEFHQDFDGKAREPDYPAFLEKKLGDDLSVLALRFSVSPKAALMIAAMVMLYFELGTVRRNFIMSKDLERFLTRYEEPMLILKFCDVLYELEERNILKTEKAEFYPVRVFWEADRNVNDYYLLPAGKTFVPFADCRFELTEIFINKIMQL